MNRASHSVALDHERRPKAKRIAVLVAERFDEDRRARLGTMQDWFIQLFSPLAPSTEWHPYMACNNELPGRTDAYDGYIVTGSRADAHSEAECIRNLAGFAVTASAQRPVVGICFGHQLLNHFMGGESGRADVGWCMGLQTYKFASEASMLFDVRNSCRVRVSHRDQVVKPAKGATVLASSGLCPIAMTKIGANILTIQAHPEITPHNARQLILEKQDKISQDDFSTALAACDAPDDSELVALKLFEFLSAT